MDRNEANAKLAEISVLVSAALAEAEKIAKEHKLRFHVSVSTGGMYTENIEYVNGFGWNRWQTSDDSDYVENWISSDC